MGIKKKIAILADYPVWLHERSHGQEGRHYAVWLVALHEAWAAVSDYEIHWITLSREKKRREEYERKGQFFHVLPCGSRRVAQRLHYLVDRWKIGRCLRDIKPDLVHAWGSEGCYGLCAADFAGKKLFSLQGALTAYARRAPMPPFAVRQARWEEFTFRAVGHITTESEWAREQVLELVPEANVMLWEYAAEERFFRAERQPSPLPCCLLAGSHTPIKNVDLAVRAFSRPELRHVTLYLAGVAPGAYDSLPDNIIPLGFVNRERLQELLEQCWALVHPSLADCCPNIVKEARAMGLPCVVTTECGAKQYVVHGQSGFVISPHDEQALVESVLAMTADLQTSLSMGEEDRTRCREALSSKTMVDGILGIYADMLREEK